MFTGSAFNVQTDEIEEHFDQTVWTIIWEASEIPTGNTQTAALSQLINTVPRAEFTDEKPYGSWEEELRHSKAAEGEKTSKRLRSGEG